MSRNSYLYADNIYTLPGNENEGIGAVPNGLFVCPSVNVLT
jgi:hypothetical protein